MTAEERLQQIEKIAQNARTTWFGLLALLLFVGITLLSHEDADFFAYGAETTLPIVGISVPPTWFFQVAPVLVASMYCYLHIFLLGLWEELGQVEQENPARVGALSKRVYPMIFTNAALWYRARVRGDRSMPPRPIGWTTVLIAIVLGWGFGLLVVGYLWWRSMPLHNPVMTMIAAASLWAMCAFGWASLRSARSWMADRDPHRPDRNDLLMLGFPLGLALLVVSSDRLGTVRITNPDPGRGILMARAQMNGAELTVKPDTWLVWDEWIKEYRATYGQREGLDTRFAAWPQAAKDKFEEEAWPRWGTLTSSLDAPNLSGRNFRGAQLESSFSAGADLSKTDLRDSILRGAELQGANFEQARMDGVSLSGAQMHGANLDRARLQGADLRMATIAGSDCTGVNLLATLVHRADLSCRSGTLKQENLNLTVGDAETQLPDSLKVRTCLERAALEVEAKLTRIEKAISWHPERSDVFRESRAEFESRL